MLRAATTCCKPVAFDTSRYEMWPWAYATCCDDMLRASNLRHVPQRGHVLRAVRTCRAPVTPDTSRYEMWPWTHATRRDNMLRAGDPRHVPLRDVAVGIHLPRAATTFYAPATPDTARYETSPWTHATCRDNMLRTGDFRHFPLRDVAGGKRMLHAVTTYSAPVTFDKSCYEMPLWSHATSRDNILRAKTEENEE